MAAPQDSPVAPCWSCGRIIDRADRYCRGCGRGQGRQIPWYYQHWGIVLVALLGLGPFALILAWRSPLLSAASRLAYTAALLLATAWLGWRFYQAWLLAQGTAAEYLKVLETLSY